MFAVKSTIAPTPSEVSVTPPTGIDCPLRGSTQNVVPLNALTSGLVNAKLTMRSVYAEPELTVRLENEIGVTGV